MCVCVHAVLTYGKSVENIERGGWNEHGRRRQVAAVDGDDRLAVLCLYL